MVEELSEVDGLAFQRAQNRTGRAVGDADGIV